MSTESAETIALREKNRITLETYLASDLIDAQYFTDDAEKELVFATYPAIFNDDNETPMKWVGKKAIEENFKWNAASFKGRALDLQLFSTQDPNRFFAELRIDGTYKIEGKTYPYRQPYYIMTFHMRDGKITVLKEVFNPLQLLKTAGSTRPEALFERYDPLD